MHSNESTIGRLKNVLLNAVGLGAPLIGAIITVPFLLEKVGAEIFGLLSMYWVIIGYTTLFELGIGRAVTWRLSILNGKNNAIASEVLLTASILAIILGLLGSIIFLFVLPIFMGKLIYIPNFLQSENSMSIIWVSTLIPFLVLSSVQFAVLEARKQFLQIALIRIPIGLAIFIVPTILAYFEFRFSNLILGIVLTRIIMLAVLISIVIRHIPINFRKSIYLNHHARDILKFGGWLTLSSIIGPLLVYLDRFILTAQHGLKAAALYTPPFEAVIRFLIIASAVAGAMFPTFASMQLSKRREKLAVFCEANFYVMLLLSPIVIVFIFFARDIFELWLGDSIALKADLEISASVAAVLSIGLFVNGCAHIPQAFVQAHGRTSWTAGLHIVEICAYLIYAPQIIDNYGIVGAAYTWLLRASLSAVALYGMAFLMLKHSQVGVQV